MVRYMMYQQGKQDTNWNIVSERKIMVFFTAKTKRPEFNAFLYFMHIYKMATKNGEEQFFGKINGQILLHKPSAPKILLKSLYHALFPR